LIELQHNKHLKITINVMVVFDDFYII
jgi:hypothetical protein